MSLFKSSVLISGLFFAILSLNVTINWFWSSFILIISFSLGYLIFNEVFKTFKDLPSIWPKQRTFKNKIISINPSHTPIHFCHQCNDICCHIQNHHSKVDLHPWRGIKIDKGVDESLEEILELTLKEYIQSWYKQIGYDHCNRFDLELRHVIRCAIAELIKRVYKVDATELIVKKLLNLLINHVEVYVHGKRQAKSSQNVEECVLIEYGKLLHPALISRKEEIKWLQSIVQFVLPYLLAPKYLNNNLVISVLREILSCCILLPVMDEAADPDNVNAVIELLFDKTPLALSQQSHGKKVDLLENFISSANKCTLDSDTFGVDLKKIISDEQLLFLFTQFAKDEGFNNLLEFLFHVNSLSNNTLNPDLNEKQLKELHHQTYIIFNKYFSPKSVDHITFDSEIYNSLKQIVNGKIEDVNKLRTEAPLYRAYEMVYNKLENYYCLLFFQSDLYFKLLCGQRKNEADFNRKNEEQNTLRRYNQNEEKAIEETNSLNEFQIDDPEMTNLPLNEYSSERLRDLSSWRVSIVSVENRIDVNGKEYDVYVIKVQRLDIQQDERLELCWEVERRYHEFYVLEAKLREFHGEKVNEIYLPAKRSFLKLNKAFLESRRLDFEKFLKQLLTCSHLRGSELVFNFLRCSSEEFTTGFLPEIKLGKIIKNVPAKLTKERGQHLEPFLLSFIQSTESPRLKNNKSETTLCLDHSNDLTKSYLKNSLYNNNLNWQNEIVGDSVISNSKSDRAQAHFEYIYDYILFFIMRFYKLKNWVLDLIILMRFLLRKTTQSFFEWYLNMKIHTTILEPNGLVTLLKFLRDSLFDKNIPTRTSHQKNQRSQLALKNAKEFFPFWLINLLDKEKHEQFIFLLFSMFQYPLLNKQILYLTLDIIVKELFPELLMDSNSNEKI